MDVLGKLQINMGYIVGCVFANSGNGDEEVFLEAMFKMIEHDIGINFDSERFHLLDFRHNWNNIVYFDIDYFNTPLELLVMIRDLIKHGRMSENIKNKKYLIHFRDFKQNVFLEDKENTLRVEAFLQAHSFMRNPIKIRIFLVNKYVSISNTLKDDKVFEVDLIKLKIQLYRIECVLVEIEKRTIQTN